MGIGKLLLIGGVVGGGAYLLMKNSASQAAASSTGVPAGWNPPAGAIIKTLSATSTPVGKPLTLASWPADASQPAGQYLVIWDSTNSQSFVALFYPTQPAGAAAAAPAVMAQGTTPDSALILAQLTAISVAVQQANVTPAAVPATAGWR